MKSPVLVASCDVGGNRSSGVAVKISESGLEIQEFLGSLDLPETELTTLLLSCGTVGLLNQVVAAGRPEHLLMVDRLQGWDCPDGGPVTGQLVGADRLWDVEFSEQISQERSCRFGISVALWQDVEDDPVLVHGSPEPVTDISDGGTDFVHVPPGTGSGFPVTQLFSDERREFDVPLAKRVVEEWRPQGRPFTTILTSISRS